MYGKAVKLIWEHLCIVKKHVSQLVWKIVLKSIVRKQRKKSERQSYVLLVYSNSRVKQCTIICCWIVFRFSMCFFAVIFVVVYVLCHAAGPGSLYKMYLIILKIRWTWKPFWVSCLKGLCVHDEAGLWLYMEVWAVTHLLHAHTLPLYHIYGERTWDSTYMRVHNSTYSHRQDTCVLEQGT